MKVGVAHVTSVHPQDDIRIFYKECKSLARAGYDVCLVVPTTRQPNLDQKGERVKVLSLPKVVGRARRIFKTLPQVWRQIFRIRKSIDVFHFHDPELIPVAVITKVFLRKRVVFDAHEDFPLQILGKYWIPGMMRRPASWAAKFVEFICMPFMSCIVAATPAIAKKYPEKKTVVVQNFPIVTGELTRVPEEEFLRRENRLVYLGGISRMQGAMEIVEAFDIARSVENIKFTICGKFENDSIRREAEASAAWRCVEFKGWQNRDGIRDILNSATIGIVVDHPLPNYLEGYSTKLFEYMMAGIPVICSNFPLWREIVEGAGCGVAVDPLNVEEIASALVWLSRHKDESFNMGLQGRIAVENRYNWANEEGKLLGIYKKLTA